MIGPSAITFGRIYKHGSKYISRISRKMARNLGYYVNYTPKDGGLFGEMESYFGSTFQNMTPTEKCWLIYKMGYQLWFHDADADGVSEAVEEAEQRIEEELSVGDRLGLLQAILDQLKETLKHQL
ncbi:MAG: hypothetical protein PUP93_10440 [Rhizonema sp. NSF051]|nr:hypothetical protein [Rhizonema sp. NSF051]